MTEHLRLPVGVQAHIVAELREKLKDAYQLQDGDDALETTLEGETELPETLAQMARQVVENERLVGMIKSLIKDHQARATRLARRAESLRGAIAWALQEAGWKRIPINVLPEMTVSLRKGEAPLIIPNEAEVPDMYCTFTRSPLLNTIRSTLENVGPQSWAYLGNNKPSLTIKTG